MHSIDTSAMKIWGPKKIYKQWVTHLEAPGTAGFWRYGWPVRWQYAAVYLAAWWGANGTPLTAPGPDGHLKTNSTFIIQIISNSLFNHSNNSKISGMKPLTNILAIWSKFPFINSNYSLVHEKTSMFYGPMLFSYSLKYIIEHGSKIRWFIAHLYSVCT